jgi:ubiquinone/menaquinone biosynthesis C-methylase UbiE
MTITDFQKKVEAEWNNGDAAAAWARWHDKLAIQGAAVNDRLMQHARVRPGVAVLDLASGTGHPGIALAHRVTPSGSVMLTDLSPPMLDVARARLAKEGLANVAFEVADAHRLPFADASFDAITCRLGIMYFTDLAGALREIARVLKPGGRVAFAAWGRMDQGTYAPFILGPAMRRRPMPPPPPGVPWPGRFSEPGLLRAALVEAGYSDVTEENAILPFPWPGTPRDLSEHFYDVAIPMRPLLDSFSPEEKEQLFQEALAVLPAAREPDHTEMTVAMNFVSGAR